IIHPDGLGWLYAPSGLVDGPLPTHYEPHESPVASALHGQSPSPTRQLIDRPENPYNPTAGEPGAHGLPFVLPTARPTQHPPARGGRRAMTSLAVRTYGGEAKPAMGFFTDTSLCIGCKACEVACKEWNQIPESRQGFTGHSYDNTIDLGADTWRHVAFIEQRKELSPDGGLVAA